MEWVEWSFGALLAGVLFINLLVSLAVVGLRLKAGRTARLPLLPARPSAGRPFFTVHVPTCNEPPEVVIQTLDALRRQTHSAWEVIVLDNNTRDPSLWQPVQRHCQRLGEQFRFIHVERLEGAKSGALNLCLELADPRADVVCVVDADYVVTPNFLERAAAYLDDPKVSFVQFPQAYRNVSDECAGLADEYAQYFDTFLRFAQRTDSVLLTGTLSVIRRSALEAAGRWCGDCLTEDAELGARLQRLGRRGSYAEEVVGHGLMPGRLRELRKQRRRWVYGNAQTLVKVLPHLPRLGLRRASGVVAQLTAWFNFLLLPSVALLTALPLQLASGASTWTLELAVVLAGLNVLFELCGKALVLRLTPDGLGRAGRRALRVFLIHLGTSWEGAVAWWASLRGQLPFERTSKFKSGTTHSDVVPHVVAACIFIVVALAWLSLGEVTAALGSGAASLALCGAVAARQELSAADAVVCTPEDDVQPHRRKETADGRPSHQHHDPHAQPRPVPRQGDRGRPPAVVLRLHRHRGG